MFAAVANNVAEIRRLVAEDATTLEALDSDKDTALVYAVRNRNVAATEVLIELGADVQAVAILCPDNEDEEMTPEFALHGACMWTSAPCIRYLLDSGVNPNCYCAGDGVTPLTTVLRSEEEEEDMEEAIQLLMKKGANPFKTDPTGWNTLMWFAEYGIESAYIMRLLVPPGPTDAMAAAAARLIQTSWRLRKHSQSVREERDCVRILTGLKFTVVNETAAAVEDNWFMDRMLRVN
jgi:ankyrin repeat protein